MQNDPFEISFPLGEPLDESLMENADDEFERTPINVPTSATGASAAAAIREAAVWTSATGPEQTNLPQAWPRRRGDPSGASTGVGEWAS